MTQLNNQQWGSWELYFIKIVSKLKILDIIDINIMCMIRYYMSPYIVFILRGAPWDRAFFSLKILDNIQSREK